MINPKVVANNIPPFWCLSIFMKPLECLSFVKEPLVTANTFLTYDPWFNNFIVHKKPNGIHSASKQCKMPK